MRHLVLLLALSACDAPSTDAADDTDAVVVPPDPHVDTTIPPGFPPANPVRLVLMGDSITAGVGASKTNREYRELLQSNADRAWPDFTEEDLATRFPSVTEVIDVSRGGATTYDLRNSQLTALAARLGREPADGETLVVFTIGGNDAQRALNPLEDPEAVIDSTLANMEAIIEGLQDPALFAEAPFIYATNIYEPSDGVGQVDDCFYGINYSAALPQLERYNTELAAMGDDLGFSVVDLRGHFLGHGFHRKNKQSGAYDADDPTLWFESDCIHPNDRGHHEIRRLFFHAIEGTDLPLWIP